ncbi:MAG: asparagine synthase (glutamine-hydrolyzing) [Defluviitaleaceae bacterium]|nr:asparagine synthase (glutamine-hydrolyzing) [Defluviitaleaceae bacterium]MCL2274563.1 asparagine synthase (glutamine-hydrolyzing) [Defluviitaleaceae bacterium]
MCGFCGFTGNEYNDADNTHIKNMAERISHRGPDGEGFYVDDNITFGFRRLSFFDLKRGSQPMHTTDDAYTLVFNGEIYNYSELRAELAVIGHNFSTTSDTEVLLHLYEEYGEKMLDKLRGMFAFVIYDHRKQEIFAARDFFGIKPFYYGVIDGQLLFASEMKSFLDYPAFQKELNPVALEAYLSYQYSVLDETFFKGIFKLPAAHFLRFKNGVLTLTRYWQAQFAPDEGHKGKQGLEDTVQQVDQVVRESVNYHQRTEPEVILGTFLSGGWDSSYITSLAKLEKSFSVGFEYEGYSEIESAEALAKAKGMENYSKIISTDEYWDALKPIQYFMDEPLADPAAVALYFVCKEARKHVKGALTGEGADELFGGYEHYHRMYNLGFMKIIPLPLRRLIGKWVQKIPRHFKGKRFLTLAGKPLEERYIGNFFTFTDEERARILQPKYVSGLRATDITKPYYDQARALGYDDITKMQYLDIHLWLAGDIMLKADKMSMAHSLEARVPFLDREVFNVAAKIPTRYRVNRKGTKYALRQAALRSFPDGKPKQRRGFPVPTRVWLREEKYYKRVRLAFEKPFVGEIFQKEKILQLLARHKSGKEDNSRMVWTIYMFILWYESFF